jgi:4-hydroxy-tetrahydrodipicolinate reductase
MGTVTCAAIERADDLALVARVERDGSPRQARDAGAQVVVDFTTPDSVMDNIAQAVGAGLHVVVGTSGFDARRLEQVAALLQDQPSVGVVVAPNFAIGAVLLASFARAAAPWFESAEVVELHHPDKQDAPSGTAMHTARVIAESRRDAGLPPSPDATLTALDGARGARVDGVPVHSVRLRGLLAHQEVLLGNVGEVLTLRHDSLDRESFMPGVLLAVRRVTGRPGVTVGLEPLLALDD